MPKYKLLAIFKKIKTETMICCLGKKKNNSLCDIFLRWNIFSISKKFKGLLNVDLKLITHVSTDGQKC